MRAIGLISSVALALVWSAPLSWAQSGSPDKPASPQTLTGPSGKDTRGEKPAASGSTPKGEAVTKSEVKGRVNALSPEEKHRAARARERAAAKAAPSKEPSKSAERPAAPLQPAPRAAAPTSRPAAAAPKRPVVRETRRDSSARHARVTTRGRWTPRVGAVVPRGVPLYPMPPGYRSGPIYGMRPPWFWAPRPGFPPYPRVGLAYPAFQRDHGDIDDDED